MIPTSKNNTIVLVTGTDTGVGKTYVSTALARVMRLRGLGVAAIKPVESGCGVWPNVSEDAYKLAQATGQKAPQAALDRLGPALAPPTAAEMEGRRLSMKPWLSEIRRFSQTVDCLLVEGAGGLLSPLTWEENALDLAKQCQAKILLIAKNKLGVLNHILLTLRVLAEERVEILGVVLSQDEQPDLSTKTNPKDLARLTGLRTILDLPYFESQEQALEPIQQVVDWIVN